MKGGAFWMVVATRNGAQTPYNFATQATAQQFMQGLSGIDGVQLLKMQGREPVQCHNDTQKVILGPPAKGKPREHDPISSSLREATQLIARYPAGLRRDLSAGLCASGGNGWQLLQSFPWLAVRIFAVHDKPAKSARELVRQGAKTREIAEAVNVPMCFKRFIPKVSERLLKHHEVLAKRPDIVSHHCPPKKGYQSSWLTNFGKALSSGSEEFAFWVALHWQELFERESDLQTIRSTVCDLRDWVRACMVQSIGSNVDSVCQIICEKDVTEIIDKKWRGYADLAEAGKPFNKEMSLQTVFKLSEEWHERQSVKEAADVEFPQAWYEGGTVGVFRIEPVNTSAELSKFAYHLHNCGTSYAHKIADGESFFYVVFEGDELKAMLEIGGCPRGTINQLKGPRNSEVAAELRTAVLSWWATRQRPGESADNTVQPLALAS